MAALNTHDAVFWISLAGLFVLIVREFLRSRNTWRSLLSAAAVLAFAVGYFTWFQSTSQVQPKSDQPNEWAFVVVLYLFMLAGMASSYLYGRFASSRTNREPFDIWNFVAPVVVSPIVFIPLLGAFQSVDVDLAHLSRAKMMIFLVTFENGFVWKQVFDNRKKGQRS
jgi:drug/metabolite transporter (DMT)-like permease